MNDNHVRVMIVEDEAVVAMDIAGHLASLGYIVTALCSSGKQALEEAEKTPPDIALMDINLGGTIDGIETAQQLRTNLDIPVIFFTVYADEEILDRAKIVEPLGYLINPFDITRLESTLEMTLYKHVMEKRLRESERRYRIISELVSDFASSDITEQKKTERKMRQLSQAVEQSPSIVVITDTDGRIEYVNPKFEELTGYYADEVINKFPSVLQSGLSDLMG